MIFYAFDLEQYERERGFYYDYRFFVPGKIVKNFDELTTAILNQDFEAEKIEGFKKRFFDDWDGRSAERVVNLIKKEIRGKRF